MQAKSIFLSKTVIFNAIAASLEIADVLPIPTEWKIPIIAVGNIILRYITTVPVKIL